MSIFKMLYGTILDAIFPISKAEQEVLAMEVSTAFHTLPRASKSPIPESCSVFSYKNDLVWRLIWSIKYKKSAIAARIAAYAIFRSLSMFARAAFPIIIVPMPITRRRRRERGFNQCELIAGEIERLHTSDVSTSESTKGVCNVRLNVDRFMIAHDLLSRVRHKSRQTLKDREDRLESAHDIFKVDMDVASRFQNILKDTPNYLLIVIDDVVTTGSTIRDAIQTLHRAGFERSFGLSVAH